MMANCLMHLLARRRARYSLGEWEQDLAMREGEPWVPQDYGHNANIHSWNSRYIFLWQGIQLWG